MTQILGSTLSTFDLLTLPVTAALYPPGWRYGCQMSNNSGDVTNDIDITAGNWIDSTNTVNMILAAMTKKLDAGWAAGTNQGFRNSGAAITDTTYHVYAVCKAAGANPDYYAHTSTTVMTVLTALQAEAGGTDYIYARRIFSIMRESGAVVPIVQDDKMFKRKTPGLVAGSPFINPGTAAVTRTLLVPVGLRVEACFSAIPGSAGVAADNPTAVYFSDLSQADVAANAATGAFNTNVYNGGAVLNYAGIDFRIMTNTSGQVRSRVAVSTASTHLHMTTHGWIDTYL
jgi:hypothetical protein